MSSDNRVQSLADQVRHLLSSSQGASEETFSNLMREVVEYHLGKVDEMVLSDLVAANVPQAGIYNARNTLLHKAIDGKKTFTGELKRKGCRRFSEDPVVVYLVGPNTLYFGAKMIDEGIRIAYHR